MPTDTYEISCANTDDATWLLHSVQPLLATRPQLHADYVSDASGGIWSTVRRWFGMSKPTLRFTGHPADLNVIRTAIEHEQAVMHYETTAW